MFEAQSPQVPEESKNELSTSERLMKRAFDILVDRAKEGIFSGRISVIFDAEGETLVSTTDSLKRLATILSNGGIIVANHTEPGNIVQKATHMLPNPVDFGSPPMDAIILIALIELMQETNDSVKRTPPMMLRRVEYKKQPNKQAKILRHVELDRASMAHRVN